MIVDVVIPALNEADSVGLVLKSIERRLVRTVYVVDNGSVDATRENAQKEGAVVLEEAERGYGAACLKGMAAVRQSKPLPDVLVFMDADFSDHPEQLSDLLLPIAQKGMDMVIGSRALGQREEGSMTFPQRFGNALATRLLFWIYGEKFTDLGPFRAIRWQALEALEMKDRNYGWTVEMQIKAAKNKLKTAEVAVDYRRRIGKSKVSGTVKGSVMAGYKILTTLFKYV